MTTKIKQTVTVENKLINVGSLSLKESTYKQFEKAMKKDSRIKTLPHLKNIVLTGVYVSRFSKGDAYGYLFTKDNENVLVSIDRTEIVAAYKSAVDVSEVVVEQPLPIIIKEETKPTQDVKVVKSNINTDNVVQIGDITIDINTLEHSSHFIKRIKERFYITDEYYRNKFVNKIILKGEYLGITLDKDLENDVHTFSRGGVGVFISLDGKRIVTVYEMKDKDSYSKPKEYIKSLLENKIKKLKKDKNKIYKRNTLKSFDLEEEIIKYERKLFNAKSEATKLACQARINALRQENEFLKNEVTKISKEVNQYTKSLIVFT